MNNIPTHKHHHHEMPTLPFIRANSSGKYVADYPVEDPFDDLLPDCSSFLKDVIVQKKTTDESYQPRRIVITESRLYFAHLDDGAGSSSRAKGEVASDGAWLAPLPRCVRITISYAYHPCVACPLKPPHPIAQMSRI